MSRRLLLVDDEDAIRTIARISLERIAGWTVIPVASGQAALEAAEDDGPFDAVLLDVMMPGLDGPTTYQRLRDGPLHPDVPVIFLTAKVAAADREHLRSLGAAGVIAKPFDPMTLADQIRQVLG
jgi:two-component system, OmpR family, alkaline phosphatase synthesis response regulator PhoP